MSSYQAIHPGMNVSPSLLTFDADASPSLPRILSREVVDDLDDDGQSLIR